MATRASLKPLPQFGFQFSPRIRPSFSGVVINQLPNPLGGKGFELGWLAVPFTLFWIVGMMKHDQLAGRGGWGCFRGGLDRKHGALDAYVRVGPIQPGRSAARTDGGGAGFFAGSTFRPRKSFLARRVPDWIRAAVSRLIGGAKVATALLALAIPILARVAWQIINRLLAVHSPFIMQTADICITVSTTWGNRRARLSLSIMRFTSRNLASSRSPLPNSAYKLIALVVIGRSALCSSSFACDRSRKPLQYLTLAV